MLNRDYRDMLSVFCAEKVEFLLVGAYALAAHGLPRATGDMDLWVRAKPGNARRVWRALAQIGVAPRRIDILTAIEGVDFEEAWQNRMEVEIEDLRIPVLSREDLVRNKKAAARPQDLADVSRLEAEDQG